TCDLALATTDARFATPGVNIGLFCSTPMVALSRNVTRKHAMEMLLLGEMVSAQKACEIGLINGSVKKENLDQEVLKMAKKIASKSPITVKIGKRAFYDQIDKDLESAYSHCGKVMVENLMTQDASEGISAFIEKRTPTWCGE
ncbi:MAG: enoyl-CoA hydratase, partial [Proteobacteria bacterium]|nr:enoyl-CoA hydratase [Pseudomonadota bacterium]